jgi:hypothetical protein
MYAVLLCGIHLLLDLTCLVFRFGLLLSLPYNPLAFTVVTTSHASTRQLDPRHLFSLRIILFWSCSLARSALYFYWLRRWVSLGRS